MNEQWQELKETIIEMRDNDGTGTQQEVCKFLANLMDVLEKQMKEPKTDVLDKIRAEIDSYGAIWVEYKIPGNTHRDIENIVENVLKQAKEQVLEIIDKYKAESEDT